MSLKTVVSNMFRRQSRPSRSVSTDPAAPSSNSNEAVFRAVPILQVFWCHPTTDSDARADMGEQYFAFLENICANIDLPDGWDVLTRNEILAFAHENGQHALRCVDEHLRFLDRADETYCLRMCDHFPGWHPNAVHLRGDLYSAQGNPVPYATMVQFARAIRDCCRGVVDVRIIAAETSFPKPEENQGCETPANDAKRPRIAKMLQKSRTLVRQDSDDGIDGDSDDDPRGYGGAPREIRGMTPSAWQTAALQFDPKYLHFVIDPEGDHGTHMLGQFASRGRQRKGAFVLLGYEETSYLDVFQKIVRGMGKRLRDASVVVLRARTFDGKDRTVNCISELAMACEEWSRQSPSEQLLVLVVRGPMLNLKEALAAENGGPKEWRAWTFDGPGHQAGLVPVVDWESSRSSSSAPVRCARKL